MFLTHHCRCRGGRTSVTLWSLAFQGKRAEAEPLYERSQAIVEKVLGPDHPDMAKVLDNRAMLLEAQVRVNRFFSELL